MPGDQEHQPAAVAEHTVDQDKCGGGDMPAAVVTKRKVRMHPDDVRFVMSLKREELGGTEYLDEFTHLFTPEKIEEMRRLHEELAVLFRKDNDEIEARQAQMARELSEKGYVEIDEVEPAGEEVFVDDWGPNVEEYDQWANEAEYDRWAIAYWESTRHRRTSKFPNPVHDENAPGWTVRRYDAEDEEEQYGDEELEDEYEELDDEVEDKYIDDTNKEDENKEGENTNDQTHSDGETATLKCN
ncbi:unnamed protein product [Alopecurus aequalis]